MLTLINRISLPLFAAAVLTIAGCSDGGNSSFVYGPATLGLIQEAQNGIRHAPDDKLLGVKGHLDTRFGDPQEVRFWSKLPLDAGGEFGFIEVTPNASGAIKELKISFDEPPEAFAKAARTLQFVTGAAASTDAGPEIVTVTAWGKETITGTVAEDVSEESPATDLKLSFEKPLPALKPEATLRVVTGGAEPGESNGEERTVASWNSDDGIATLDVGLKRNPKKGDRVTLQTGFWIAELNNKLTTAPTAGDQVVLDGGTVLQHGRTLYQRHCSHCHGTSGDGAGPTAEYLTPRPRDYRHGIFKFTSTQGPAKASRDDLERILRNGIPGTYMPSFVPMLDEEELDHVVEYVRFLAMRGEFERRLAGELASDFSRDAVKDRMEAEEKRADIVAELESVLGEDINDSLEFVGDSIADGWSAAEEEDAPITPLISRVPDSVASRQIGRELFLSKDVACADCHGIDGRGDGPQTTIFEKNPVTEALYDEPGLHDVWDNVNQPRNLTYGIYRGGRRPVDLFRRVHAGIKGTRMPSFKNLEHEKIWHIVNYVLSVPFESEPGRAAPTE